MQPVIRSLMNFSTHTFTRYGPPWGISSGCVNPGSEKTLWDLGHYKNIIAFHPPKFPNPALRSHSQTYAQLPPPLSFVGFYSIHPTLFLYQDLPPPFYFFDDIMGGGSLANGVSLRVGGTEGSIYPLPSPGGGHGPPLRGDIEYRRFKELDKVKNWIMESIDYSHPETIEEERWLDQGVELGVLERVDQRTYRAT